MASFNKVILIGNLTRDPQLRYTSSGQAVCDFSIAINRKYFVNGQEKEEVCFVDIVAWSKQAESCGKYLSKGSCVFVEGRLRNDNWEDREGRKRSKLRITADRVQFMN
ncbi:MAG: single-stranded DNA-binding protein, partial [Victivallales bacterium]|nr:single-stranded DNA-binding protein [Victivallales bacterium]